MSKLETLSDWTYSDSSIDETIVMNSNTRTGTMTESRFDVERDERQIDERYAEVERSIKRDDDIATAYLDVLRYADENIVFILDRCSFEDFREFVLGTSSDRKLM